MCGVVGIVAQSPVNQTIYDSLIVLQHRGQDAAGIMTCEGGRLFLRKAVGLVRNVFQTRHMLRLRGNLGIGHVRYPTAGCASSAEAQPLYVNSPFGLALAHNGNLINATALKKELFEKAKRHINTSSDSEVLLNIFAHELYQQDKRRLSPEDIFKAVEGVHSRCQGAYGVVAMIAGYGIIGFRDPNGIRPLVFGKRMADNGITEYMIASESVALASAGFDLVRDVAPGEAVFCDREGNFFSRQCAKNPAYRTCLFEYVYFARPDSIIDGVSVYQARLQMGVYLAEKILREMPNHEIDVVIPVPDTSRTSALELSYKLGVLYREGFIKNRYIGRTFIMPGQKQRVKSVRQKLNAIEVEFKGKNVLIVDDSIVRGTTSGQIIQMARDAGATKVFFASAAPPVCYQNIYGIDMPSVQELVAYNRSTEEVAKAIGADWLIFQDLDDLKKSVSCLNPQLQEFDASVFDGKYVTGVEDGYLDHLEGMRKEAKKRPTMDSNEAAELIDMHNSI